MWKEYFVYGADFLPLAAGVAGALPSALSFIDRTIRIDSESHFELRSVSFVCTSPNFYIKYKDSNSESGLQKDPADVRLVGGRSNSLLTSSGVAFLPHRFIGSHILQSAGSFIASLADFSGSSNTIRLAFHGSKINRGDPPWIGTTYLDQEGVGYTYPTILDVSANSSLPASILIDTGSDFLVEKISVVRSGAALISISDSREYLWFNTSMHVDNVAGAEMFQNDISKYGGRFIHGGSLITIEATDLSGVANRICIGFTGRKMIKSRQLVSGIGKGFQSLV